MSKVLDNGAKRRTVDAHQSLAERVAFIERSFARRRNIKVEYAREPVARALGVSQGTIERIRGKRRKTVDHEIYQRVARLFVECVNEEIRALEHMRDLARFRGEPPHETHVCEIETHLSIVRRLLETM
jgi:thymidine phosphorylase